MPDHLGLFVASPKRCENCGEYVFFNHHMWSNGRTTHGPGDACERAAEAICELPLTYDVLMGAVVQINELLGRFICGADDDEYADPERLQRLLHDVYHLASEGVRAELIRKEAVHA